MMIFNEEETKQFVQMMTWAKESKEFRSFSVTTQGAVIFITGNKDLKVGKKVEGFGQTLTSAMESFTKVYGQVKEAEKIFNG